MRIRWRGLQLPSQVSCDTGSLTSTYGKFMAEPFERGFGTSIGNSLRRILISSLEGSAVTQVKIQGIQHEFSTLPGVVEDMTDVILNIKSLVVKNYSDEIKTVTIEKSKGVVTGADVKTDGTVDVINKDLVLATLTAEVPFKIEMLVENGRGYRPATDYQTKDREVGVIPVDALFSPVRRVKWEVEETRVGKKTNYDRLILEIWTDGSLRPDTALVEATKILRKHLNPFLQYNELGSQIHALPMSSLGASPQDSALDAKLNQRIIDLQLSQRALNCLNSEGIKSVRDLVRLPESEVLKIRSLGDTTLNEIKAKLTENGLRLGMPVPDLASV